MNPSPKLKGKGRPINTADRRPDRIGWPWRMWIGSPFFEGDTPEDLLREIQPDILVKGGDYDKKRCGWLGKSLKVTVVKSESWG